MSRKPVFAILFALVLVGLLNPAFKIQSNEATTGSGYETNLDKAALFLDSTQFDSTVGLCREAPNVHNNTFWLVSDNLLAYHALRYYYPETAETVYATMLSYGYFRSYKHEALFGTTIPYIPFKTSNTYVVAQIGPKSIETEVCNGSPMYDYEEYADLCLYAALHFYWSGNIAEAIDHFNVAKCMWNGTLHGVYDEASRDAENRSEPLIFSTYKLALLLYCSRILGQTLEDRNSIEETLWLMQDKDGGLHTDYDINLNCTGSDVNTETTSIAILAYKYEPKIVNRPVQYSPSLNVPPDYQKIQEAVNCANVGDTIFVYNGTYGENVVLNKTVSLIGKNRSTVIIDGNKTGNVVTITVNDVNITGFTIQNSGELACDIKVDGKRVTIQNNNIINASNGVCLHSSSSCTISGNNITANDENGIWLDSSSANTLSSNIITDNGNGILLVDSVNNTLSRNSVTASDGDGIALYSSYNTLSGNNVTGNKGYGVGLYSFCHYDILSDNNIARNRDGILLDAGSGNNVLSGNNVTANDEYGIWLYSSFNNTLSGNDITANKIFGIWLYSSSHDNVFYHNNLINNTQHVHIEPQGYSNTWNNSVEGNYWSTYIDADLNHDGIGDSSYVLGANNSDHHPLLGMFLGFNTSLGYEVDVISNSTIENFEYIESCSTIRMEVSNSTTNQTFGFCRVCIPHALMNVNITVTIDDGSTDVLQFNNTIYDNGTCRWIYFAYQHSTHEVIIVPELPSFLILPLFMIAALLAAMAYKRKHLF